jgi:hypothetical protein
MKPYRERSEAIVPEETIRRMGTGELVRRLINNMSGLVDREVELAKEEARADAKQMGTAVAILIFGGLLLYTFLAALIVAGVLAVLAAFGVTVTPPVMALIIAGVFLVLGAIVTAIGYFRVKVTPLERTRKTVQEDLQWARSRMS